MKIEVSNGEILDKLTIIQIKLDKISDPKKIQNLQREYIELFSAANRILPAEASEWGIVLSLKQVNELLWDIEDQLREKERQQDFGEEFVQLARMVYHYNDKRALLKRELNAITNSALVEEKSYEHY